MSPLPGFATVCVSPASGAAVDPMKRIWTFWNRVRCAPSTSAIKLTRSPGTSNPGDALHLVHRNRHGNLAGRNSLGGGDLGDTRVDEHAVDYHLVGRQSRDGDLAAQRVDVGQRRARAELLRHAVGLHEFAGDGIIAREALGTSVDDLEDFDQCGVLVGAAIRPRQERRRRGGGQEPGDDGGDDYECPARLHGVPPVKTIDTPSVATEVQRKELSRRFGRRVPKKAFV